MTLLAQNWSRGSAATPLGVSVSIDVPVLVLLLLSRTVVKTKKTFSDLQLTVPLHTRSKQGLKDPGSKLLRAKDPRPWVLKSLALGSRIYVSFTVFFRNHPFKRVGRNAQVQPDYVLQQAGLRPAQASAKALPSGALPEWAIRPYNPRNQPYKGPC